MPDPEDSVDEPSDESSADNLYTARDLDSRRQDDLEYPGAGPEPRASDSTDSFYSEIGRAHV